MNSTSQVHSGAEWDNNPPVTVVIPAYNAETTIVECLESVLNQEVPFDYETIVVNDGSYDQTSAIVRKAFPSVRLLDKANGGPGSARNFGVEAARGDVVLFLDADDRMLPGRIAFQGEYMMSNECVGLTFGNQQREHEPALNKVVEFGMGREDGFTILKRPFQQLLVLGNFIANTTSAVRKSTYLKYGRQPTDIHVAEDYAMNLGISRYFQVAATARNLSWYRAGNGTNLMSSPHAYYGPVRVLFDQLTSNQTLLTRDEHERAYARWVGLADMLLRYEWQRSGRMGLSQRFEEFAPLLPVGLRRKWSLLSIFPGQLGTTARFLKRKASLYWKLLRSDLQI